MKRFLGTLLCLVVLAFMGCDNESPAIGSRDCRSDGVGCNDGFACIQTVEGFYSCQPDDPGAGGAGGEAGMGGGGMGGSGGMGGTPIDDADGDGVADGDDNCLEAANPDQTDTDGDGLGDACDDEPNVANLKLRGQFLTVGGRMVDDEHTLKGQGSTGRHSSDNNEFSLRGSLSP